MEISIPTAVTLIDSDVVDYTEAYDQSKYRDFKKGLRLQDLSEIWERTGEDLSPPDYDAKDDAKYKVGDVLWAQNPVPDGYGKSGTVKGVIHVAGRSTVPTPLQPDLYPKAEKSLSAFSLWKERYVHVKGGITGEFNGLTFDAGVGATHHVHRLYKDPKSHTGWTYEVSKDNEQVPFWKDSEFMIPDVVNPKAPKTYYRIKITPNSPDNHVEAWYHNEKVIDVPNVQHELMPYQTVFPDTAGGTYAGINFMVSDLERVQQDANGVTYKYYRIAIQGFKAEHVYAKTPAEVLNYIDSNTHEQRAYYVGPPSNDPNSNYDDYKDTCYVLQTFILRGSNLYARTQKDSTQLFSTTTKPKLVELETIRDFKGGWTYVSPIEKLKPFDNKNYTYIESMNELTFKISITDGAFNTIALTGVIAGSIDVETFAGPVGGGGHQNMNVKNFIPDTSRDIDKRLPPVPTTVILYNTTPNGGTTDTPAGGHAIITLRGRKLQVAAGKPDKYLRETVRVGGIFAGLSVNAGFTNLVFNNKYKDYSPYEKDQWGNVTYIEGVKTNIHNGSVDVPIRHYDMMNRLMVSLGKGLVVLNGSDTKRNVPVDNNRDIFAATMVVGRIRDFQLRTNLDNKAMGEMATYTFTIEEEI